MSFPKPSLSGTATLATMGVVVLLILGFALGAFSVLYAPSQTNSSVGVPSNLNLTSNYYGQSLGRSPFGVLDIVGAGFIIGLLIFGIGGFVVVKRRRG